MKTQPISNPPIAVLDSDTSFQILTISEVCKLTTLSRSTIYRLIKSGSFPKQISISKGRSGFREKEVYEWQKNK